MADIKILRILLVSKLLLQS